MKNEKYPITQAVRFLRERKIPFTVHLYEYVDHGGTQVASEQLGIEETKIIKTVVMEDESRKPLVVLMHGDKEVSTQKLARFIGAKKIVPCDPKDVTKHTGYIVGGTSPFGTKSPLRVFMESSISQIDTAYINGGKRGFLVGIKPEQVIASLAPQIVEVGV